MTQNGNATQTKIFHTADGSRIEWSFLGYSGQYAITEHYSDGYCKTFTYPPSFKARAWDCVKAFINNHGGLRSE